MRSSLLSILRCPLDYSGDMSVTVAESAEGQAVFGTLKCPDCGTRYPIEHGIPRLLPRELASDTSEESDASDRIWPDTEAQSKRMEMKARDEQADDYDRMWWLNLFSMVEVPAMLMNLSLRPSDTLLEAGCGTGRMTRQFAGRCDSLIAMDYSWESLLACKRKLDSSGISNVDLVQADICRLPFRSGSFDRVVSCQVLEHVPTPESRSSAVEELARVAKRGGNVALSAYQYSVLMRLFGEKEGQHGGGIYFYRFTRDELRHLLSRHLKVESITGALVYHYIARCRKGEV